MMIILEMSVRYRKSADTSTDKENVMPSECTLGRLHSMYILGPTLPWRLPPDPNTIIGIRRALQKIIGGRGMIVMRLPAGTAQVK